MASVKRFVEDFFWDCSEITLDKGQSGGGLALKVAFVPEMPLEHTQGLFKLFEAMFNAHGYVATQSTVRPDFLRASFKMMHENVSMRT